jgi:L-fuconolactonase
VIIDSHQHFWDLSRTDYGWLTPQAGILYRNYLPADLQPLLQLNEVAGTVLVQAAPSEEETRFLLQLASSHGFVRGVVGWVDFEAPDASQRIAALKAAGGSLLKGLRPMVEDIADPEWITRPALDAAFAAMIAHDLVFDALVKPRHLQALRVRLLRHPHLRCVLDHAGKPDIASREIQGWAHDIEELAADTSACCKLSGLLTEAGRHQSPQDLAPYVTHLFRRFGPDRLLWGSDWPVLNAVSDYTHWLRLSAELTQQFGVAQATAVMGDNATRVYRLEDALACGWSV